MAAELVSLARALLAAAALVPLAPLAPQADTAGDAPPLTLDQAIAEARSANARLPVVALDRDLAGRRLQEVTAERRGSVAAEGELWLAPMGGYDPTVTDGGDERLQVVAERTIFDGGGQAARLRQSQAEVGLARARYRQAVADLDREVRETFAAAVAADREAAAREDGLERLRRYLTLLEGRAHGGQPLAADLLGTRVRLAADTAALVDARGRAADARAGLDVLMGRPPDAPLALAPLTPPQPPPAAPPARPSPALPEIAAADREVDSAEAALAAARADRAPRVTLRGDAGLWGSDPLHPVPADLAARHPGATVVDRLQRDLGAAVSLGVRLPLFGTGGVDARIAQAELALEQARWGVVAARTEAEGEREQARLDLASAWDQYRLFADSSPVARDAVLDAESRYWGGAATYLEVLSAYSAAVENEVGQAQAELAYRRAEARLVRWGGAP